MCGRSAIFILTSAFALSAPDQTPLRRSINSILEMREQNRLADASAACEDALPLAGEPATAAGERALLLSICGAVSMRTGELSRGRNLLEAALNLWREMLGPAHPQVAATALDLACVYRLAGRYQLSQEQARTALDIYQAAYGPEHLQLNEPLVTLGLANIMLGQYADAESNLNRALSLLPPGLAPYRQRAAATFSALGLLYFRQGRYFEAERWFRQASSISGGGLDAARTLANLASVYVASQRYDKADTACSQALDLMTSLFGPRHAEVASALQILAEVRRRQKRYLEAASLLQQALDIVVNLPHPDRLNEALILNALGVSYVLLERYAEGESSFRSAILIQESLGGDARRDLSVTLHNLARASSQQGRYDEALELASRAFAMREADLPNVDSSLLEIMVHKAELLRRAHRKAEAANLEQQVRRVRAERSSADSNRWIVDLRELQRK